MIDLVNPYNKYTKICLLLEEAKESFKKATLGKKYRFILGGLSLIIGFLSIISIFLSPFTLLGSLTYLSIGIIAVIKSEVLSKRYKSNNEESTSLTLLCDYDISDGRLQLDRKAKQQPQDLPLRQAPNKGTSHTSLANECYNFLLQTTIYPMLEKTVSYSFAKDCPVSPYNINCNLASTIAASQPRSSSSLLQEQLVSYAQRWLTAQCQQGLVSLQQTIQQHAAKLIQRQWQALQQAGKLYLQSSLLAYHQLVGSYLSCARYYPDLLAAIADMQSQMRIMMQLMTTGSGQGHLLLALEEGTRSGGSSNSAIVMAMMLCWFMERGKLVADQVVSSCTWSRSSSPSAAAPTSPPNEGPMLMLVKDIHSLLPDHWQSQLQQLKTAKRMIAASLVYSIYATNLFAYRFGQHPAKLAWLQRIYFRQFLQRMMLVAAAAGRKAQQQ